MTTETIQVTARGLCSLAGLAWFIYDSVLTLDSEIIYIWQSRRWTFSTALFFTSRALSFCFLVLGAATTTFVTGISAHDCVVFHWLDGVGAILIFINAQITLQYRLWALYSGSRRILYLNAVLFVLEIGCAAVVCGVFYTHETSVLLPEEVTEGCLSVPQRQITFVFFVVFAYELWLACLALYKVAVSDTVAPLGGASLIRSLGRDSIAYFFLISASVLVVVLVWIFLPLFPGNAAIAFPHAAAGVGSARLLLSVKHDVRQPDTPTESTLPTPGNDFIPAMFRERRPSAPRTDIHI